MFANPEKDPAGRQITAGMSATLNANRIGIKHLPIAELL